MTGFQGFIPRVDKDPSRPYFAIIGLPESDAGESR